MTQPKVVAFGGGHGLAAVLRSLRQVTQDLTAVVTVADNGGSSGRLREEFNTLPPGDLRMALAALCSDDEWGSGWADLMQYRFTSNGALDGHALGNLILAALWDRDGDQVAGLERVGALLKVVGRVLPMALVPLDIEATFATSRGPITIRGQKEVALGKGELLDLRLISSDISPTPEVLDAIAAAQWITLGPGSWFSSVLPHLLLPIQRDSITSSAAKKIILLNLAAATMNEGEEMSDSTAASQLSQLRRFAPNLTADFVLCDTSACDGEELAELESVVLELGAKLVVRDLALFPGSKDHDPKKLAPAFAHIFNGEVIR